MPAVRSYAGCALRTAGGDVLGTLAVYGHASAPSFAGTAHRLLLLAEQAAAQAELRSRLTELALLSGAQPAAPSACPEVSARALLESAPVAIYHTDAAGEVLYSNSEYRRIFGLKPGHSGDAWSQCVHPDDRAGFGALGRISAANPSRLDSTAIAHRPTTARFAISRNKWSPAEGVPGLDRDDRGLHRSG